MATKVHVLPKMGGAFVAFFCCGEIDDVAKGDSQQPAAWNMEIGAANAADIGAAAHDAGPHDGGADFLPETRYAAVMNEGIFLKYRPGPGIYARRIQR